MMFFYFDGTGSQFQFGPLAKGRYQLSFVYSNSEATAIKLNKALAGLPIWSGKATTQSVFFDIIDP